MVQLVDVAQQNIASSPMNSSWFSGAGDFLSTALDGYIKYEQVQAIKDSGNLGQVELTSTVETPNPNTNQTYVDPAKALAEQNKNFAAQAGQYLQTGVGLAAVAVGGIAILYWLTRQVTMQFFTTGFIGKVAPLVVAGAILLVLERKLLTPKIKDGE